MFIYHYSMDDDSKFLKQQRNPIIIHLDPKYKLFLMLTANYAVIKFLIVTGNSSMNMYLYTYMFQLKKLHSLYFIYRLEWCSLST